MTEQTEFPKWVTPHESWLVKRERMNVNDQNVTIGEFSEVHTDREGKTTVLVNDADEEKLVTAAKPEPNPEEKPEENPEEKSEPVPEPKPAE
jgi:hypothetical protein